MGKEVAIKQELSKQPLPEAQPVVTDPKTAHQDWQQ